MVLTSEFTDFPRKLKTVSHNFSTWKPYCLVDLTIRLYDIVEFEITSIVIPEDIPLV